VTRQPHRPHPSASAIRPRLGRLRVGSARLPARRRSVEGTLPLRLNVAA